MHLSTHYKHILVLLLLLHTTLYANHFALIFVDDIVVPVPIKDQNTTISDTTSPNKPTLTIAPQATTYDNAVSIEIQGEVGSTILVNGTLRASSVHLVKKSYLLILLVKMG